MYGGLNRGRRFFSDLPGRLGTPHKSSPCSRRPVNEQGRNRISTTRVDSHAARENATKFSLKFHPSCDSALRSSHTCSWGIAVPVIACHVAPSPKIPAANQ